MAETTTWFFLHLTIDSSFVKVPLSVADQFQWPLVFFSLLRKCVTSFLVYHLTYITVDCLHVYQWRISCLQVTIISLTWVCFIVFVFSFSFLYLKSDPTESNIIIHGWHLKLEILHFFSSIPKLGSKNWLTFSFRRECQRVTDIGSKKTFSIIGEYIKDSHGIDNLKSNGKFLPD